jgi:hypothetical protein
MKRNIICATGFQKRRITQSFSINREDFTEEEGEELPGSLGF